MSKGSVQFHNFHPAEADLYDDIVAGFEHNPRSIPPKYFYDQAGSQLFDQITQTKDYYPTRTECSILSDNKKDIISRLPKNCILIEPGGGSCSKVQIFLNELQPSVFIPMDISETHLKLSSEALATEFPWLTIHALCNDFTVEISVPDEIPVEDRVVFFPGSSIGNFHPDAAVEYMQKLATLIGVGGQFLIGVDLKKEKHILERAYNDTEDVTSDFNLNLLTRINRELKADFDLEGWQHYAYYNDDEGRIEMHLRSLFEQIVKIKDHEYYFDENECIHTENSYKYSIEEFQLLASKAGFNSDKVWVDENNLFSVHLFSVKQ